MAEIVNLRRARKDKARKKTKAATPPGRVKAMVPKRLRKLEEARREKILHDIEASRLEDE